MKISRYRDVLGQCEYMHAAFGDFVYPRHVHETFAIGLIERGAQYFVSRKGSEIMPEQKLCVINPDTVHEGWKGTDAGWTYRMFYPSVEIVARSLGMSPSRIQRIGFGQFVIDDLELYDTFTQFHQNTMTNEPDLGTEEQLIFFLTALFRRYAGHETKSHHEHRVAAVVMEYLDARKSERVSVGELASIASVSETQVIRDFTKSVGMSPYAFQIARRVEKAKELLAQGHSPATVAFDCGFADQSHLTRHFRRIVGETPGRFARFAV